MKAAVASSTAFFSSMVASASWIVSSLACSIPLITVEITVAAVVSATIRKPMGFAAIAADNALNAPDRLNVAVVALVSAAVRPIVAKVCAACSDVRPLAIRIAIRCSLVNALLLTISRSWEALSPSVTESNLWNCSKFSPVLLALLNVSNAVESLEILAYALCA